MSSTIHVSVPTDPMARSVDQLSHHVDGTTVAIVAMKVATIEAEAKAADLVCRNVDSGFRSLIASQISQKSARAKAVVDARLMELTHQKKTLLRIHDQMERDFHRIAGRYLKLFQTLDIALKSRVFELDRAPALLVGKQMPQIESRIRNFGGQPFVYERETLSATQMLSASKVKGDTASALHSMVGIIHKTRVLQSAMSSVADSVRVNSRKPVLLPVVLFEADDPVIGVSNQQTFAPAAVRQLESYFKANFDAVKWAPSGVMSTVKMRCSEKIQNSDHTDRIKKTVSQLLVNSDWNSPQGGAV